MIIPKARQKYHLKEDPLFLPTPVLVPEQIDKAAIPTVCFVSRWDKRKRPEIFFELAKAFPQVRFLAAGQSRNPEYDRYLHQTYGNLPNLELTQDTPPTHAAIKWYAGFNKADGDQNGEVNIADITPIGQHFNETWSGAGAVWACLPADYDGNTLVNLSDITPIGQNFTASARTFSVQAADDGSTSMTDLGTLAEDRAPDVLGVGEHHRDEVAHRVVLSGGSGALVARRHAPAVALQEDAGVDAEVERDQHQDDGADATAGAGSVGRRSAGHQCTRRWRSEI